MAGAIGLPPIEFKFVKDDFFDSPSPVNSTNDYGKGYDMPREYADVSGFPAPQTVAHLQEADRLEREVAAHDQKVRDLASQPLTVQNLETQIQELLDGQESLRYELRQVKMQVEQNSNDLETMRREMRVPLSHPGSMVQAPPPMPMPQPVHQPMTQPMTQPVTQPMQQPPAMQTQRSQRATVPPDPSGRYEKSVHSNLGYCSETGFDATDLFSKAHSKAMDSALSLHQTVKGYVAGYGQNRR